MLTSQPVTKTCDAMAVSPVRVDCTHCGLPVPKGLVEPESTEQFCCSGCRAAWQLIHASGLDAWYSMVETRNQRASLQNRKTIDATDRFAEFDQELFLQKFGRTVDARVHEIVLVLDGIHCAACIWLIEKLPQILPGVLDVKLNWARQTARIRWLRDDVSLSGIARVLYRLGYTPAPVRESEHEIRRRRENRRHLVRIGIAGAAAGNNMLISAALYLGMFSYMSAAETQLLRVASCLVGLVSLVWPGRVFLQGAVNALRTRTPHMDLPIALGLTAGSVAGVVNTIRGTGEIWFDSLSVLVFLLLVGRWIQFRQQNRAADAVEMLYRLTPRTTRRIIDGQSVETFVDLVQTGDLLEIRAGELFPADARVVAGCTEVDESILSGESRPSPRAPGDLVLAGTQNRQSVVTVRAEATGRQTRLSKIVDLVEQASLNKPKIVEWANQIGGYFVVAVMALAVITFLTWLGIDASRAVDHTVALLIIACPCALALATPLAISVALGRAARRRIMVKGGDVLQFLNRPGMMWLDKTGTLTTGNLQVVDWFGDPSWQAAVVALEKMSSHPVARAIVAMPGQPADAAAECQVDGVQEHAAGGISGVVNGHAIRVGNARMMQSAGARMNDDWPGIAERIAAGQLSPCWVSVDGAVVAIMAIGDSVRDDTITAIQRIRQAGWQIGILSGDHPQIVWQIARRLGIDTEQALGGLSPEDKVRTVRQSSQNRGSVVMVGDGVNDSAALAAASVGIAVHNGAEASLAAAPVYLADEGLQPVLELIDLSRATGRTIRTTLVISVAYNVLGASCAALGLITPLVAAILMPLSSLTVVAIALTAGRTGFAKVNR